MSSVNEMRNAFDHLMRCYESESEEECRKQIEKAKGHLFRAGYDAYELLGIEATMRIKAILERYDANAVTKVFPEYYEKIYPTISEYEKRLMEVRANKRVGYDFYDDDGEIDLGKIEAAFSEYEKIVNQLLALRDEVVAKIPALEKAQEDKKREERRNLIKDIVLALVSAFVGWAIGQFFK